MMCRYIFVWSFFFSSCLMGQQESKSFDNLSFAVKNSEKESLKDEKEFATYWYTGQSELTSYNITQYRYGEARKGQAVLIFVTEQFLPQKQVKADKSSKQNRPILKLNSTKNYLTGIYPYSLMSSVYMPINKQKHALKIVFSAQEWCGQTFMQLNNKTKFDIKYYSYFEKYTDTTIQLDKYNLENDIWVKIRLSPDMLFADTMYMIPSFEYLALNKKPIKAYLAYTSRGMKENGMAYYQIIYPDLKRALTIWYENQFPYAIDSWEESCYRNGQKEISKGEKIKRTRSTYWNENRNRDVEKRKEIGLN